MKTLLKKRIPAASNSIALILLITFLEMNSERLYRSSGTKESHCFVLTSSTKHEIRDFDTVVEQ